MTNYDQFKKRIFRERPNVKKIYDSLGPRYDAMIQIIRAREKKKLTQHKLALKIGTKQSAIARFEAGNTNPSLAFLQKLATALNTPIKITLQP